MIAIKPRHFVNRGSVLASGFMIRWNTAGMNATRNRILDLWQPGLQVKRTGDAFIVLFPVPIRVIAEEAIGEPLVRHGRALIALPLERREIDFLSPSNDCVIFAQAGRTQMISLAELPDEDITQWIDTESVVVADVVSLGMPPAEPSYHAPRFDSRDIPGVPPASSELQGLLAELRQRQKSKTPEKAGVDGAMGLATVLGVVQRLFRYIRNLSFWRRQRTGANMAKNRVPAAVAKGNPVWHWLKHTTNRLLNFTRFSRLLSLRHARYMARMVAMMQSGDIEEGLRHAIPLADAANLANQEPSWFGLPRRRSSLSIFPFRTPARSAWVLNGPSYNYLRSLYRQAFQRLEAQGRVEEAAFVLTELLASHAEAVSFLEKHGRLHLAAEIAEAKELSPALAIRLWWLAKERNRAIVLACRTGEFEKAIQYLAGNREESDQLRLVWAERLAASGKYIAAVEVIWPVPAARHLARQWLTQAIDLGGTAGGMALARKTVLYPESFPEVLAQVETLMADETEELASGRRAFAESLYKDPKTTESKVLARIAIRALVRDIQSGTIEITPAKLRQLVDHTMDPCLRVDVPALPALKPATENLPPAQVLEISAGDSGHHSITDIALLPDGKLLVALGEAGLLFLSRDGKTIAQLNQPAHKLVVSDDGSRVIGIAPRDSVSRLVRIDVLARTASYWCDTTITAYTDNFDGSIWCVANNDDIFLVDTLAKRFETLWRIPDLGGHVRAMQRNRKKDYLYVLTDNQKQLTLWTFNQPSCVLRSKQEFSADLTKFMPLGPDALPRTVIARQAVSISEEGHIYEQLLVRRPDEENIHTMVCKIKNSAAYGREVIGHGMMSGSLRHASAHGLWIAIPVRQGNSVEVFLLTVHSGDGQLVLRLRGAQQIALRFADDALLCADDQGRIVVLNILTRKCIRDIRV
jgi:hypothetical protein